MTHLQKSIMKQIDGQLYPQLLTLKIAKHNEACSDLTLFRSLHLHSHDSRRRGSSGCKEGLTISNFQSGYKNYDTLNSLGLQSLPMTHNLECI